MVEKINQGIGSKTIKIVFMLNVKINSRGGMERTLLSFIKYMPPVFRNIYDITIVQTTGLDKERIKEDEIYEILETNNVKLITLDIMKNFIQPQVYFRGIP